MKTLKPLTILDYSYMLALKARARFFQKGRLIIEGTLTLNGFPLIVTVKGSKIILRNNVRLNSRNLGYHLNLHSPVKLMADRRNAKISIGQNTRIHGSCIHAFSEISIGKNCLIAANCQIFDSSGHKSAFDNLQKRLEVTSDAKRIVIEDDVWVGANTIILPGVVIGTGSVIGAGSVLTKDIPAMSLAAGNPAQVIKTYAK